MTIEDHPTDKTPNAPATPEPAGPAGQPGAGARQSRQAGAAAMITFEFFTYTDEQWGQIRTVVRDALGLDADQIKRQITRFIIRNEDPEESFTERQWLRSRIEIVSLYHFQSASIRQQRPRRAELIAFRKETENLRASIIAALAVQIDTKYGEQLMLLPGVDVDMLTSTNDYFTKLARNLNRQIEQAGQRGDNARKTDCDQCWSELLAIWCELGGKASGKAAASFLIVASKPVMGSAVPDIASVMRWLERRQNKTAKKVTKPVRRRATR